MPRGTRSVGGKKSEGNFHNLSFLLNASIPAARRIRKKMTKKDENHHHHGILCHSNTFAVKVRKR
jgi:hypothetical protein